MSDNAAGWQPDPTGKHDHRYWDGTHWTDNVADAGVAATDPYEAPSPEVAAAEAPATEPEVPAATEPIAETPGDDEPTVVTPIESPEPTATYPTASPQPDAPEPYAPPTPVPDGGGNGASKRGLVIGGAILAAVALAVIAFLALSGDDDEKQPVADSSETTTTTEPSDEDPESLEDLRDACADGDFAACDDLYFSADLGSDLEEFGSTCGGIAEPQSGSCEATNGGQDDASTTDGFSDGNIEEIIADTYEEMFGISREKAECLAGKISGAIEDGSLTEEQAMTEIFDYLEDCDISMEEISGN